MTDVPLRPGRGNFYGVFLTTTGYQLINFATHLKPQIDAAKSIGANCIVYFGDVQAIHNGMTLGAYLALRKQIQDYCLKIGMFTLCYEAISWVLWTSDNSYSTATPTFPTWAEAATILAATAALIAPYPNVIGAVTMDEPFNGVETSGPLVTNCTTLYNTMRNVLPSDIPVCGAPNPCGNSASPVWAYSGQAKTNMDSVASICDFLAFHPFAVSALSDSAALRAAYPTKQIAMPSSCDSNNGDGDIATKMNSIFGLVGSNGFRLASYFILNDYPLLAPTTHDGMFDSGTQAPRTAKTVPFTANIVAPLPTPSRRRIPGNPRLNQYYNVGYT